MYAILCKTWMLLECAAFFYSFALSIETFCIFYICTVEPKIRYSFAAIWLRNYLLLSFASQSVYNFSYAAIRIIDSFIFYIFTVSRIVFGMCKVVMSIVSVGLYWSFSILSKCYISRRSFLTFNVIRTYCYRSYTVLSKCCLH